MREVLTQAREEPGCLRAGLYRSTTDPGEFYVHSCWRDEAAWEDHRTLPHTATFRDRITQLIDQPLRSTRTVEIG